MTKNFDTLTDSEKLDIIFNHLSKVNNSNDIETSLMILADMGRDIVAAERCTIWLLDKTNQTLYTKVAHGVERIVIEKTTGVVGECIRTEEVLCVHQPYEDERFNQEVDIKTGFVTKSILAQPLFNSKKEVIGAMQALNKKNIRSEFNDEDKRIFAIAGRFCADTLESFELKQEIENSRNETIQLLGQLCEKRSLETDKHTARVSLYAETIAKRLNFSREDRILLRQASALHDIGKLATPDRILLKPGKLTYDEYMEMQTHAEVGCKMLEPSKNRLLQFASIIAHQHHEKYDGTGYPQRLKGEEIHIFARIVALADVFDAISSKRCYKEAWSLDESLNEIAMQSGLHFDPKVVEAFFAAKEEVLKIYKIYRDN